MYREICPKESPSQIPSLTHKKNLNRGSEGVSVHGLQVNRRWRLAADYDPKVDIFALGCIMGQMLKSDALGEKLLMMTDAQPAPAESESSAGGAYPLSQRILCQTVSQPATGISSPTCCQPLR